MGDIRERSMSLDNLPRGSVFALLLIVAGAVLFLDNIGILPIPDIQAYWPVFIVFWGATMLERWRNPVSVIWGMALMAWGVLLILGNLHILPVTGGVFWAIALIAGGVTMLVRPVQSREWNEKMRARHQEARERQEKRRTEYREWREKRRADAHGWSGNMRSEYAGFTSRVFTGGANFFGNRLRETTVFGSLVRRVQTQQFEGGKVEAVFGSIELDLAEAAISSADHTALLDVAAVFGGVEITVPRTWRVVMRTAGVLGGCNDRTIPPRPEPGVETPTLVVTGAAVFGGIEIRN
jgi:predicted membrane protein